MNMSRAIRQRLWAAGALMAPVLVAAGVRAVLSTGPAMTVASTGPRGGVAAPEGRAVSPEEARAERWLDGAGPARVTRSPMLHVPAPEPVHAAEPAAAEPEPVRPGMPALALSGVVSREGQAVALINGRLRGVGEEAAPGWRIEEIDRGALRVTLRGPDGRVEQIHGRGRGN